MKIRVLLHKPKRWDLLGQAIRIWTGLISAKNRTVGPYDHAEVWTPDDIGLFKRSNGTEYTGHSRKVIYKVVGTCWTSTMKDKAKGTVKRPASDVVHNPIRWDYIEIEFGGDDMIYPDDYDALMNYMEQAVRNNKGYGKWDFAKFFGLGWLIVDKKRNICSEFCNNALWNGGILEKHGVVSPRRLAYLLVQAGHKIERLK